MPVDKKQALKTLGKRIRELREEKDISSAEMSRLLDMERSNYSRIETGKQNPTYTTLLKICDVLGTDLSTMFKSNS